MLGETEFGPFFDGSALIALQAVWLSALTWRGTGGVQRLAPFVLGAVLAAALVARDEVVLFVELEPTCASQLYAQCSRCATT